MRTTGTDYISQGYTLSMMPKDTDPQPAGDPPAERSTPIDLGEPHREGVLSVERHHKADGRLLILYRRVGKDG